MTKIHGKDEEILQTKTKNRTVNRKRNKGLGELPHQGQRRERLSLFGTKAWERLTHPFLSGISAEHTIKGMAKSARSPISSPADNHSSSQLLLSTSFTMSSASSSGANCMRAVRRRMLEGKREVSPFIFNKQDYTVSLLLISLSDR